MSVANLTRRSVDTRAEARTEQKLCVLGAGSSGLAAAKSLRERGIAFDVLEREDDVGGNWYYSRPHSSVYESTRTISSKLLTEYPDFPMPAAFPDFPDRKQVWAYLRDYAEHFDLYPHIQFQTCVRHVEPTAGTGWDVTLASGERRTYRGLVVANGHNWDPRWPVYRGRFDGVVLHSSEYKSPASIAGQRVLVVGGGNSGFDIATECARHAAATFHSLRRGYRVLPRYHNGQPVDVCGEWMLRWRLPLWFRRMSVARTCKLAWSSIWPREIVQLRPDHQFFETHPVINGTWPVDVARGAIGVRPDISRLDGNVVEFTDGSRETIDTIIYATGYRVSFPFLRSEELNWRDGRPELFLNIFHPERDDLFVVGLIQPDSGQFGLVHHQSELVAAYVDGLNQRGSAAVDFQRMKRDGQSTANGGVRYVDTPRHWFEVEHHAYRRLLEGWLSRLEGAASRSAVVR
jgi:hypothetical protein